MATSLMTLGFSGSLSCYMIATVALILLYFHAKHRIIMYSYVSLQCYDTVGLATGRASGL